MTQSFGKIQRLSENPERHSSGSQSSGSLTQRSLSPVGSPGGTHLPRPSGGETYRRNWEFTGSDQNLSLAKIFEFVPAHSRVLDIGCGYADLGSELKSKKSCIVWGIEQDPERAEVAKSRLDVVLQGDVTSEAFLDSLPPQSFDVIILADVLEHLLDGERVLRSLGRFLTPPGCLIVSVPNVAHAAVRIALFEGRFSYSEEGLLDKTHVKFYTRDTLSKTIDDSGFIVVDEQNTFHGALDTEIPIKISGIVTESLVKTAEREPDGTVYQFILKLLPEPDPQRRELIQQKFRAQTSQIASLASQPGTPSTPLEERKDTVSSQLDDIESRLLALENRMGRFLNFPPIAWLRRFQKKFPNKS